MGHPRESTAKLAARIIGRLLLSVFVLLLINSCVHREARVDLGDGYEIVATSGTSPCSLNYRPWVDERQYSGWYAIKDVSTFSDGVRRTSFLLGHRNHESLEFENEEDWRRAWHEYKAAFGPGEVGRVEGITAFQRDGRYVIGSYDKGFFILDMVQDQVNSFAENSEWEGAVKSTTGVTVSHLTDPKSWLVQSRNPLELVVPPVVLTWCLWPLVRRVRHP